MLLVTASILVSGVLAAAPPRTLVVFGDSLSAGYGIRLDKSWPALLEQRLGNDWKVVNASQSGETTAGGLTRLPAVLAAHRPQVVVLELGGNDGLRGLPITLVRRNLARMVELCQQAGARVLLVAMQLPPNMGRKYVQGFAGVYAGVAAERKLRAPPFLLEGLGADRDAFQPDQIHPTEAAQPRLLANVWPGLEALVREVR